MSATSSAAHAGMVLGTRYELVEPIASGGMAQVWSGRDLSLSRPVAVKVLHPHLATDDAFVTRFRREARASARLSHPSIVAVYDTMSQEGIEAIVMELVDGRTLRSVLDEVGALPPADVIDIGMQISDALDVAHRAGVVHRDIKPANIMVATDRRILVTDFGIAKATKDDDLTHTGTLLGTAKYLAPEQVTGEPVDPRADVYALGIVLFEAATGSPPFQADTDAATALARLREEVPRCRQRRPDVPMALDAAIARAMARHPDQRWDRAQSFRAALGAIDLTRPDAPGFDLASMPPPVPNQVVPPAAPSPHPQPSPVPGFQPSAGAPVVADPGPGSGSNPVVGAPPSAPPGGDPAGTASKGDPSGGDRPGGRTSRADRKAQRKLDKERRKANRRRSSRTIFVVLVIGALVVAGALLAAADGGGDGGSDDGSDLAFDGVLVPVAGALPFDPEGTPPFGEVNSQAPRAVDRDAGTAWRTETYRVPIGQLKSGVGLMLTLEEEQALRGIQLLSSSDGWRVEVYVGDDFGENGEDFDREAAGEPVAVLEGGEQDRAALRGATGPRVLLWITETGTFDDPERGEVFRFVLREVALI
ncbi:MAG: protein kinase [Actinomycetota bacterium]